jgi:hypothetical protein
MDLSSFLLANGLTADPFAYTNAEEEDLLSEYFVPPPYFNSVKGDATHPKSTIVFAPRGGGKTAQRRVLEEDSRQSESNYLCVLYDRFAEGTPNIDEHLKQICLRILVGLLVSLEDEGLTGEALVREDRDFLRNEAAVLDSVDAETFHALIRSLKSDARKMGDWLRDHSGPIKAVVSTLLAKRGVELDPAQPWGPQMTKARETPSLARLRRLLTVAQHFGIDSVYLLIDKLDETAGTATDPKKSIDLVSTLLLDLTVMELPGLAVKVFAWNLGQDYYHELGGRRDRIQEFNLTWSEASLAEMMTKRLTAFSDGQIQSLNDLAVSDLDFDLHSLATFLSAGSPRDLIRMCGRMVSEHINRFDADGRLSEADVWQGVTTFAAELTDERAKKFLPDLIRLDAYRFTQNHVANDLLKISKQATGAKVSEWRKTGLVDKITEMQDARFRPQHLYGVSHPMLAIALRPGATVRDILEFYIVQCIHCGSINHCDEVAFRCSNCQRDLTTSEMPSLMSIVAYKNSDGMSS